MTLRVDKATEDDVARFYGGIEFTGDWEGYVIRKGKLIAAFAGIFRNGEDWFAIFEVPAHLRTPTLYRRAKRFLAGKTEPIKAVCDMRIPRAEEFMTRLGFEPTDEVLDNKVIWKCPVSKH